ncbi:hypothetical protein PR202_ga21979 [Eleusine coracana subsp. coracana]|uniref:Sulfotransferase n=1 Tax=Eleusine coracana subsp. coracana TaxID=191504 RepID=A0AAV5D2C7_ELECO|nr:hypothetical protein PR202_ga21979 [Eleusine coracana subsp. coracana]
MEDVDGNIDVFAFLPSLCVLATHLPHHLLPERIGRVVYVCRDPKDALVSGWLFTQKVMADKHGSDGDVAPLHTLEEAFELFCDRSCVGGPVVPHARVLGGEPTVAGQGALPPVQGDAS